MLHVSIRPVVAFLIQSTIEATEVDLTDSQSGYFAKNLLFIASYILCLAVFAILHHKHYYRKQNDTIYYKTSGIQSGQERRDASVKI